MSHATASDAGTAVLGSPVAPSPVRSAVPASRSRELWRRFRSNRAAVGALAVLTLLVLAAIFAPLLTPYDPDIGKLLDANQGPSGAHWLGTDDIGRDVFTRLLFAGRVSLTAMVIATGTAVALGLPAALAAGFFGGKVDAAISRVADLLMTLPTLIMSIAVIAAIGPGLRNAMVVYGLMRSPRLFRVVRSAVLAVRAETFVEASLSMGTKRRTIILRHVLPNVRAPFLVEVSVLLSGALVAEASLSFLGLGVVPPTPSWGQMLSRASDNMFQASFQIWPPGLCVAVTALALNVVADGLRDAFGREELRG